MFRETASQIEEGRATLGRLAKLIDLPKLRADIDKREAEAGDPSFWANSVVAKKKSKELNDLKKLLGEYQKAEKSLDDLKAHLELAAEVEDEKELKEVQKGLAATQASMAAMDSRLKLTGEFDGNDAIVSFHAGAGGTEACDWCDMLIRMYTRWAEKNGFEFAVTDMLKGDEAGVKSLTAFVRGPNAYGFMKGELGGQDMMSCLAITEQFQTHFWDKFVFSQYWNAQKKSQWAKRGYKLDHEHDD